MSFSLRSVAAGLVLVTASLLSGCGGSSAKPAPGMGCALNSDCATGLICTFGLCHGQCVKDTDCNPGMCVKSTAVGDAGADQRLPARRGGPLLLQQRLQVAAGLRSRRAMSQPVPERRGLRHGPGLHHLGCLRGQVADRRRNERRLARDDGPRRRYDAFASGTAGERARRARADAGGIGRRRRFGRRSAEPAARRVGGGSPRDWRIGHRRHERDGRRQRLVRQLDAVPTSSASPAPASPAGQRGSPVAGRDPRPPATST